jgi:chromate reductase
MSSLRVLGICGSLRKASLNRALLHAAQELAPADMSIEVYDLHNIPLYDDDLRLEGEPEGVVHFKQAIANADALLISSPEYNYSIPGVLKNALDWASRPANDSPLRQKPAALMGAGGMSGTMRGQLAIRQVFQFTQTLVMPGDLPVQQSTQKFDGDLKLTDERTREQLSRLLVGLAAWTRRLQTP